MGDETFNHKQNLTQLFSPVLFLTAVTSFDKYACVGLDHVEGAASHVFQVRVFKNMFHHRKRGLQFCHLA
jgi:hypothetical protein